MRVRLPPIKKTQIAADPDAGTESPKGKVNFILETGEHLMTTETKRPLLTPNETDKPSTRAFDEEMKASSASPKKKILINWKDQKTAYSPIQENENNNELDFDDGLLLLQKTFNLKTTDILQNLRVEYSHYSSIKFFRTKTTKAIKLCCKAISMSHVKKTIDAS